MVTLQLQQIDVPPVQRLFIHDIDWSVLEEILAELGEKHHSRIAYSDRDLEIRMPPPEHELNKELISDTIKIILEELEIDCECYGSTTFRKQEASAALEPDQCFYIQNHALMRAKERIDLTVDPPPDLALEVDVTSKTKLTAYAKLRVPELWIYSSNQLQIYLLQSDRYISSEVSPTFPHLPIKELVTDVLRNSRLLGRSQALRLLRQKLRQS